MYLSVFTVFISVETETLKSVNLFDVFNVFICHRKGVEEETNNINIHCNSGICERCLGTRMLNYNTLNMQMCMRAVQHLALNLIFLQCSECFQHLHFLLPSLLPFSPNETIQPSKCSPASRKLQHCFSNFYLL